MRTSTSSGPGRGVGTLTSDTSSSPSGLTRSAVAGRWVLDPCSCGTPHSCGFGAARVLRTLLSGIRYSPPLMLKPGDAFERYTIEALLGQGGMGCVYRAHDPRLGRRVALKVIADDSASADANARLVREAHAAAALDHPNAVAIFDVGEPDGAPYIVMELVEGRTLRGVPGEAAPVATRVAQLAGGGAGAGGRAQARADSPRHQARERDGPRRRHGEGARLRHRPARGRERRSAGLDAGAGAADAHGGGRQAGDARVHGARADPRRRARRARRSVRVGRLAHTSCSRASCSGAARATRSRCWPRCSPIRPIPRRSRRPASRPRSRAW